MTLAQNRDPSFLGMPAFIPEMTFGRGPTQFLLRLRAAILLAGREKRYVFADGLVFAVAVNAGCSRRPADDIALPASSNRRAAILRCGAAFCGRSGLPDDGQSPATALRALWDRSRKARPLFSPVRLQRPTLLLRPVQGDKPGALPVGLRLQAVHTERAVGFMLPPAKFRAVVADHISSGADLLGAQFQRLRFRS